MSAQRFGFWVGVRCVSVHMIAVSAVCELCVGTVGGAWGLIKALVVCNRDVGYRFWVACGGVLCVL